MPTEQTPIRSGGLVRIFPVLLLLICIAIPAKASSLANGNKRGLHMYSIDQILRLEEKEIDIGTAALVLSRQWASEKNIQRYRNRIDDMALEVLRRMDAKRIGPDARAIPILNEYLFEEEGFQAVKTADNPDDLFLHTVLDKKKGYCLSLSVLYLAVAERIGLPVYGVVVPGHFFVRYDDGQRRYNIETTSRGGTVDNQHYIKQFKPPKSENSIYLTNLSTHQTFGCFFNNLGNGYATIGDIDTAQTWLERAARINPSLSEARTNLGNIYLRKGWYNDAVEQYRVAMRLVPSDPKIHNNLANAYVELGDLASAIAEYRQAINIQKDFADPYRNLASVFRQQGKFKEALVELKNALNLDPDDTETIRQIADLYREKKECASAMTLYRKAIKLKPDLAVARIGLGYCLLESDRADQALEQFDLAIKADARNPHGYFGLAQAYNKLGMTSEEIQSYQALLTLQPNLAAARQNLGNALLNSQSYQEAIDQYTLALQVQPDNSGLYFNMGAAYSALKQFDQAAAYYRKALQIDPQNAAAHNALAISYYMLEQIESARTHAATARQMGFPVQKELLKALNL